MKEAEGLASIHDYRNK